ncbi:MAG TPA: T9SS type A sorting domain-containing protein [Bacteroidales bacterium]
MMLKKLTCSAGILISLSLQGIQAQEAKVTSGGNASGSGGSASYTVGEVVYTTNTATGGSSAQGVQQPFEITVVTTIGEVTGTNLNCTVYPNPVTNFLTLSFENFDMENLSYQLCDINGKLLSREQVVNSKTNIGMEDFATGVYFLKVIRGGKEIKTFKIIKN